MLAIELTTVFLLLNKTKMHLVPVFLLFFYKSTISYMPTILQSIKFNLQLFLNTTHLY